MKKIYILLMHTKTIPARIIKTITEYGYSHVGLSLEKDCNVIYSFGRRQVCSILNAGFSIESKNGDFFKKFNKTICKIYEIEVTDEQYEEVKRIINIMIRNTNQYKYDYIGIVLRFFGIPVTLKNKYVCSYFVASVLEKAKIYRFRKKTCFIQPKDFSRLPRLREIYSGRYLAYHPI